MNPKKRAVDVDRRRLKAGYSLVLILFIVSSKERKLPIHLESSDP